MLEYCVGKIVKGLVNFRT